MKAVHPPGRIIWAVIVVVGVADKDVVFESRDLCHVQGIQLVIRLSESNNRKIIDVSDGYHNAIYKQLISSSMRKKMIIYL